MEWRHIHHAGGRRASSLPSTTLLAIGHTAVFAGSSCSLWIRTGLDSRRDTASHLKVSGWVQILILSISPYGPLVIIFGIYARKGCTKWGTVLRGLPEDPSPTIQFFGVSPPTPQKKKEFVSRREPNHRLSAKHRKMGNYSPDQMFAKAFWNLANSLPMSILPYIENRS